MNPGDEDDLDLEVTLTFPVSVINRHEVGPRETATRMRDVWTEDPEEFAAVVARSITGDEYVLQVKPFSEP